MQSPPQEEIAIGSVSLLTYFQYFRAGGGYVFLSSVLIMLLIAEVISIISFYL